MALLLLAMGGSMLYRFTLCASEPGGSIVTLSLRGIGIGLCVGDTKDPRINASAFLLSSLGSCSKNGLSLSLTALPAPEFIFTFPHINILI